MVENVTSTFHVNKGDQTQFKIQKNIQIPPPMKENVQNQVRSKDSGLLHVT
jgi:hypothetical protein